MEEQLVSYRAAILAKEVGFSWKVRDYYGDMVNPHIAYNYFKENFSTSIDLNTNSNSDNNKNLISAPTQSLLQKWLREVHDLIIIIDLGPLSEKYSYEIYYKGKVYDTEFVNDTYEGALEEGLIKALKLIL